MEAQRITIALIDTTAGFEAKPERVRLGDLADFSADVATKTLEVAVRKSSLALETALLASAPKLFNDLRTLLVGELLDNYQPWTPNAVR